MTEREGAPGLPRFERRFFDASEDFTAIGGGPIGGKARGLSFARDLLARTFPDGQFRGIAVSIPRLTVVATDVFDRFVDDNRLLDAALAANDDRYVAEAFQRASVPATVVGDLMALVEKVHQPLAVRSSSLLEDALYRPFAGVYATKMIANNQPDAEARFRRLVEAIKLVWSSTFFAEARAYQATTDRTAADEKMAVIVQEVVGSRHGDRFYPTVSGVARSFNFYPVGHARPEDGVVSLALGLGKTIVDGGTCWSYSPAYPRVGPPVAAPRELLDSTQTSWWAVRMGPPPDHDPLSETEYLVAGDLADADRDGTLGHVASTYDPQSDRLLLGVGVPGPRALTFAPLLQLDRFPLNDLIRVLLPACEQAVGAPVEIEFALTLPVRVSDEPARFGFLQVRPLVVSQATVEVGAADLAGDDVLCASTAALGNGRRDDLVDVVYCRPDRFDPARTPAIAGEIEACNRRLAEEGRFCLLVGFGRWGSSDPRLGIPVVWGQIGRARVIVEASRDNMQPDPSQGSHFFHNLSSFEVLYLTARHTDRTGIDWAWLERQPALSESEHVRHLRLDRPLRIAVDGRSRWGVIRRPAPP